MIDRFFVACCIFSFICGAFFVVLIEKDREKTCTIEVTKGNITTVTIGEQI